MIPGTRFLPVLDDLEISHPQNIEKVCFVSGKLYFELVKDFYGKPEREKYAFVR
jgi:2-oxoglutarate dehydrogenase complex dehydrogenase (E1) component-like enzyme